jgi:hypothetical protein
MKQALLQEFREWKNTEILFWITVYMYHVSDLFFYSCVVSEKCLVDLKAK